MEELARLLFEASNEEMRALGMDSIQFPFAGGQELEMMVPWDEVDEPVRAYFRRIVDRIGRAPRQDGGVRADELVVLSRAGLERLEGDARLGRFLRFVAVPIVVGFVGVLVIADLLGEVVAISAALVFAFVYLSWEAFGPPRRARLALRAEVEAAITRLESGTAAPCPRVDA